MTTDFPTNMRAYAEAGFRFVEIWPNKVDAFVKTGQSLERARALIDGLGLRAAGGCAQGGLLTACGSKYEEGLSELRHNLEVCQALGAGTFIVFSENTDCPDERVYPVVMRNLEGICDVASEYGITIGLEFIKGSNLLGTFLTTQRICQALNRPNLGVLFDTFHFYAGVSKMEDLTQLDAAKLAFVHVNDAKDKPREKWSDADRTLLGEGVLPVREMLTIMKEKGYEGYASLEIFSRELWAEDPFAVARRAFANVSAFLATV